MKDFFNDDKTGKGRDQWPKTNVLEQYKCVQNPFVQNTNIIKKYDVEFNLISRVYLIYYIIKNNFWSIAIFFFFCIIYIFLNLALTK